MNTASAEVITVIDEYDADYNEAAQTSLAQGEYASLNALELEFSERARTFLKKNPPFVFDLMLQTLSSPESVRMAEGWTRIYAAQGLEIAVSWRRQRTSTTCTQKPCAWCSWKSSATPWQSRQKIKQLGQKTPPRRRNNVR